MGAIKALPKDVRAIASMINEHGAFLIEDGHEPANVLSLVNMQLQRLIDGNIGKCMNPNCTKTFTMEDFLNKNPLIMTCSGECTIVATRLSAEKIAATLRTEIPEIAKRIIGTRKSMASSAVRQGDVADHAQLHHDDANERLLLSKQLRLGNLTEVILAINAGKFTLECSNKKCDEEIPISALISSPEIHYCLACKR
jgi:RNA polymerase-binding transcription factor DksA